jgi:hypothetical protein
MANTTILTYDTSLLPGDMANNVNHPAADRYIQHLREVQKAIVAQSLNMDRRLVLAAKLRHRGISFEDMTKEVGRSPSWCGKHVQTEPAQRLIALLAYYQEALDGPQESQRKAALWRIEVANEEINPKVAISAIAELNKMEAPGKEALGALIGGDLNIIVNNNLTPGALDE